MEIKKYTYCSGDSYEAEEKIIVDKEVLDYLSREPKEIRLFSGAFYKKENEQPIAKAPKGALERVDTLQELAKVAEGGDLRDLNKNPDSYFLNFNGDSKYRSFQVDVPVTSSNIFPAKFWVKRGKELDARNSLRAFLDRYLPDYEPEI